MIIHIYTQTQQYTNAHLTHLLHNESPPGPSAGRLSPARPLPADPLPRPACRQGLRWRARAPWPATRRACSSRPSPRSSPCPLQAQAQTEVWSATLTVRNNSGTLGCSNGFANNFCSVHLSDDDFTHASTDYAITLVFLRTSGRLEFTFDTDLATATQGLTLNVDGTAFAFEDADTKSSNYRAWNSSGVSWSVGDSVSLTLTEAADRARPADRPHRQRERRDPDRPVLDRPRRQRGRGHLRLQGSRSPPTAPPPGPTSPTTPPPPTPPTPTPASPPATPATTASPPSTPATPATPPVSPVPPPRPPTCSSATPGGAWDPAIPAIEATRRPGQDPLPGVRHRAESRRLQPGFGRGLCLV